MDTEELERQGCGQALVIEDHPFQRAVICRQLMSLGWSQIAYADSGVDALTFLDARSRDVDLIICDLQMPKMDGVVLMRHLGEMGITAGIILISADTRGVLDLAAGLAKEHGLNLLGTLCKPVGLADLEILLRQSMATRMALGAIEKVHPEITKDMLVQALAQERMRLHYQPKIDAASGRCISVEGLLRWPSQEFGWVSPGVFIPLAESSGLIDRLTDYVMQQGIADFRRLRETGYRDLSMSLNVSMDNLNRADFPDRLLALAESEDVPPEAIIIEVTESRLAEKLILVKEILLRLRLLGFGLSIDDFGTGYASLSQLEELPFTELKIDQRFVQGVCLGKESRAIVEASVNLGKQFGLQVVAEGVELEEQAELLRQLGVDVLQGWLYAKAMSLEELLVWEPSGASRSN
jgi:EAL domain-containing protein (putative c-di-GMP-specific phosphodiesterase class I)